MFTNMQSMAVGKWKTMSVKRLQRPAEGRHPTINAPLEYLTRLPRLQKKMVPQAPYHTFMMDFGVDEASLPGIVVPQPVYTAPGQFARLPNIRFSEGGRPGMRLSNALNRIFQNLASSGDVPRLSEQAKKITIRINWPGYQAWSQVVHAFDHSYEVRPITIAKLAHEIAKTIRLLKNDMAGVPSAAPGWTLDNISLDELVLLELRHVSTGSWQPVLCLDRH